MLDPPRVKVDAAQAERIAWRILQDWTMAQMAILETEMVAMDQVFLPYMVNSAGETVYELYQSRQLLLGEVPMTNLERRALLGDKGPGRVHRKRHLLPCPCCGGTAELKQISGRWAVCCKTIASGQGYLTTKQDPSPPGTPLSPPIGRCGTCNFK